MAESLEHWLARLETRAPQSRIKLGLERVRAVLDRFALPLPPVPVITVGGTNGKGSVVAMLESICRAAGYRTLAYSSPHLLAFGERIRLDGQPAGDSELVAALQAIEVLRAEIELTYFEHVTLAALHMAAQTAPDVLLLEVGLGGRLDAVNAVDADVAIVTSIGLDHVEWLGRTRLAIGREKAGIARPGRPLVVGERRLPAGFEQVLRDTGAELWLAGRDFSWRRSGAQLRVDAGAEHWRMPLPALPGPWQAGNAACALTALSLLERRLPVSAAAMAAGLAEVRLPGRLQKLRSAPEVWLDVAHNAAAARALADALGAPKGRSVAVFSALADKDVGAIGRALDGCFDRWLVAGLDTARGQSGGALADRLRAIPLAGAVEALESVADALDLALAETGPDDRIVVFGSFHTVARAWSRLKEFD